MSDTPARVLVMINSLHFGGAEKHSVQLLNQLDRRLFDPVAVWLKPDEALLPELDTAHLRAAQCLHVAHKLDWAAVRRLAELIDKQNIDVVVCANEYPALYARLAASRVRRPPRLVEVFHTTRYWRLKERLQMLIYRWVLRSFDLLVYVSEAQRQYWRGQGLSAREDLCIHNGIDCDVFRDTYTEQDKTRARRAHGLEPGDYVVALCAALRTEKAHGDLLMAIAALRKEIPHLRGLLIGDGPERPRIEAMIARLKLEDMVRITGFQEDVRPLLACSDVAVLTSLSETFSIAALEAMSLGKPMVLTRVGGAAEQVDEGDNGFLYEPGDIVALCGHIKRLADVSVRTAMGARAALRIREQFSESRMMQRYSDELLRLTRARRGSLKDH